MPHTANYSETPPCYFGNLGLVNQDINVTANSFRIVDRVLRISNTGDLYPGSQYAFKCKKDMAVKIYTWWEYVT